MTGQSLAARWGKCPQAVELDGKPPMVWAPGPGIDVPIQPPDKLLGYLSPEIQITRIG